MNTGFKIMSDYFKDSKKIAKNFLSDEEIRNIFEEVMDYETGLYMVEGFINKKGDIDINNVPFANTLLISLIDKIPVEADITKIFNYNYKGVTILKNDGKKTIVPFTDEIKKILISRLSVLNIDINTDLDETVVPFHKIKNLTRNIITEEKWKKEGYDKYFSFIEFESLINNKTHNNLKNINNGKDINSLVGLDIIEFLSKLCNFDKNSDYYRLLTNGEYLIIHNSGLYIIDSSGNKSIIPMNNKVKDFFEFTECSLANKNGETEKFIGKIKYNITDILNQEVELHLSKNNDIQSGYNRLITKFYSEYGIKLHMDNLIRYPLLKNTEAQDILIESLSDFKGVLKHQFEGDFMLGTARERSGIDLSNSKSVAMMLKREQGEFLKPSNMRKKLKGKTDFLVEDITLLKNIPEFSKIFTPFFLANIFIGIIQKKELEIFELNLDSRTDNAAVDIDKRITNYSGFYEEFKILVGDRLPVEIRNLEQKFRFPLNDIVTEQTVLVNYFMRYATMYLSEKKSKSGKNQLPENIKLFFKEKFFHDYDQLESK